jgi:hypothetical protein
MKRLTFSRLARAATRKHTVDGARLGGQAAATGARHRVRLRQERRTLHVRLHRNVRQQHQQLICLVAAFDIQDIEK